LTEFPFFLRPITSLCSFFFAITMLS
jgi:hypothetical protein